MKLVNDWKDCWRWLSMHSMVLAVAMQAGWNMLDEAQRSTLPEWMVSLLTVGILVLGIVGRLVDQPKKAPAEKWGGTD